MYVTKHASCCRLYIYLCTHMAIKYTSVMNIQMSQCKHFKHCTKRHTWAQPKKNMNIHVQLNVKTFFRYTVYCLKIFFFICSVYSYSNSSQIYLCLIVGLHVYHILLVILWKWNWNWQWFQTLYFCIGPTDQLIHDWGS